MKKTIFLWLFSSVTILAFSQANTLFQVNVLKPKAGMRSAFEASWKQHLDKFHQKDDKRNVYEVTSGDETGAYVIVEGPISWADKDKARPNEKEHALDLEKNLSTKLDMSGQNEIFRWADTLSYHGDAKADNSLLTITVVKDGNMNEYLSEVRRTAIIAGKINSPVSYNVLVKQQAGSSPTLVTIRILKNGYKELDANYYNMAPNDFRDAYVKEWGQDAWDKRVKLLVDDRVSQTQHFEKFRADLSSK